MPTQRKRLLLHGKQRVLNDQTCARPCDGGNVQPLGEAGTKKTEHNVRICRYGCVHTQKKQRDIRISEHEREQGATH